MKLYARPASPFVRKVRVAAMETGLSDSLEVVMMKTPEEQLEHAPDHDPGGKIPTLVLVAFSGTRKLNTGSFF